MVVDHTNKPHTVEVTPEKRMDIALEYSRTLIHSLIVRGQVEPSQSGSATTLDIPESLIDAGIRLADVFIEKVNPQPSEEDNYIQIILEDQ